MEYQANPMARSLRRAGLSAHHQKAGLNLGIVFLGRRANQERVAAMRTLAEARGHRLIDFNTGDWKSRAALQRTWQAQGIDGLFINSHDFVADPVSTDLRTRADWSRYAVIKLGNGLPELELNRVRTSVFSQMMTTYERVLAAGFRRVLFIFHGSTSPIDDQMRLGAVLAAQATAAERGAQVDHWQLVGAETTWATLNSKPYQDELQARLRAFAPDAIIGFGPIIHSWLNNSEPSISGKIAYASPVVPPKDQGKVAGTLEDFVGEEFAAGLHMMEDQLSRGQRGLPPLVQEHTVPVRWMPGASLTPDRRNNHLSA